MRYAAIYTQDHRGLEEKVAEFIYEGDAELFKDAFNAELENQGSDLDVEYMRVEEMESETIEVRKRIRDRDRMDYVMYVAAGGFVAILLGLVAYALMVG